MCTTREVSLRNSLIPRSTAAARILCLRPMMFWLSASSNAPRQLRSNKAASLLTLANRPFWAETATTWLVGTPNMLAVLCFCPSSCNSTCSGESKASHKVSILLSTTTRVAVSRSSCTRCSRQIDRSDWVTPVSAAKMNTMACACGIKLTVSSGSAPIAFNPGVSRMIRPCLSRGCAILISAWRHFGTSIKPCASINTLDWSLPSCQNPSALASSGVTRHVSATLAKASASCFGLVTSRSVRSHFSGAIRHSIKLCGCSRDSMGNRRRQGGTSGSYPISVGHMVVRPALAGMMRRP